MSRSQPAGARPAVILFLALWTPLSPGPRHAAAQADPPEKSAGPPPPIVLYTTARAHDVRATLRLSGAVEAQRSAIIAAEVQGKVAEMLAREGDRVRAGAAVIRLHREPLELLLRAKKGEIAESEARMEEAGATLARYRRLHQEELISQEEFDKARYDHRAREGRVEQLRAEAALLEREIELTTVRAPFDGVVFREHTETGQWLALGDPVIELISLGDLDVRVEVPAEHFGKLALRPGTPAAVSFAGNGHAGDVAGKIRAVIPRASSQARTFPVLVRLPPGGRAIGVGMLADVDLPLDRMESAVIVPKDALVAAAEGPPYLYRLREDDVVERVTVTVGSGAGDWVVVGGSVRAGDRVVIRGNERLQPGQTVRPERREHPLP